MTEPNATPGPAEPIYPIQCQKCGELSCHVGTVVVKIALIPPYGKSRDFYAGHFQLPCCRECGHVNLNAFLGGKLIDVAEELSNTFEKHLRGEK